MLTKQRTGFDSSHVDQNAVCTELMKANYLIALNKLQKQKMFTKRVWFAFELQSYCWGRQARAALSLTNMRAINGASHYYIQRCLNNPLLQMLRSHIKQWLKRIFRRSLHEQAFIANVVLHFWLLLAIAAASITVTFDHSQSNRF